MITDSIRILKNYQLAHKFEITPLKKITLFMGFSEGESKRSKKFDNYLVDSNGKILVLKN